MTVVKTQIAGYLCPSDDAAGRLLAGTYARSNYVACFGSTLLRGQTGPARHMDQLRHRIFGRLEFLETDGVFRIQAKRTGRRLNEIKDGTSHTVMASEVLSGKEDGPAGST